MYRVTRTAVFQRQFETLCESDKRLLDIGLGIDWFLQRRPDAMGFHVADGYYLWITDQLPAKIPKLKIVFRIIDNNAVLLCRIELNIETEENLTGKFKSSKN